LCSVGGIEAEILAEEVGEVADEAVGGFAEGEAESEENPSEGDDTHTDKAEDHRVEDVFPFDQAAIEYGEGGGHEED